MRAEMVDLAGKIGARWTKRLLATCMKQCKVPEHWRTGSIVPIWKRKGDAQDSWKYICLQRSNYAESYEITRDDSGQEVA